MNIFINILLLIVGMILLVKGADFFVDGASSIAKKLGIPSLIIGLTLVSIGTSLPEASVSINAAFSQSSDLSFGNVVGSNIFNSLFIIGICSIILPTIVSKDIIKFDIPILFIVMAVLALFSYLITPYILDRWEAAILFVMFIAYIAFVVIRALKERKKDLNLETEDKETTETKPEKKTWISILFTVIGLAGVVGGGVLTVNSAKQLALDLGMSELLVGLTIVAVGTSLPELVTSLVASRKGENDIAVGNVIGSNIFNIIFILGFSGMINPLTLTDNSWFDVIVMVVAIILIFLFAFRKGTIKRLPGILLVIIYVAYLTYIALRDTGVININF